MFEISTKLRFSSAHHLNNYKGPCENVHGHNWVVKAYARCNRLNEIGLGVDFKELQKALKNILKTLDHRDLNTLFEPKKLNPSSENIAKHIFYELSKKINNSQCRISRIDVQETPGNCASYFEND